MLAVFFCVPPISDSISILLGVYHYKDSLGNKIASFGNFLPLVRVIPSDTLRLKISFFMKEKNIPNSIKRYRKARGLQQKDVAKVLGLKSASMISTMGERSLPTQHQKPFQAGYPLQNDV